MSINFKINKHPPFKSGYIFVTRRLSDSRIHCAWSAENDKEILKQGLSRMEMRKNRHEHTVKSILDYFSYIAERKNHELTIYRFKDVVTHLPSLPPEILKEAALLQWIAPQKEQKEFKTSDDFYMTTMRR